MPSEMTKKPNYHRTRPTDELLLAHFRYTNEDVVEGSFIALQVTVVDVVHSFIQTINHLSCLETVWQES